MIALLLGSLIRSSSSSCLRSFVSIHLVSYKEFLGLFRKKHLNRVFQIAHLESTMSEQEGDSNLVGLEAKIPGGKYDSTVDEKFKRAPPKL